MKRIAYLFAAAVMVLSAASCLKDYGSVDSMPGCSSEQYLMTIVNDSNVKTVWYIAEKGKDDANPGALPSEKPGPEESSMICFVLESKSSKDIWVNTNITHPTQSYGPEEKAVFYVFEAEVFEGTAWADIISDPSKYEKFSLSVQELVDAGYKLVFKGN